MPKPSALVYRPKGIEGDYALIEIGESSGVMRLSRSGQVERYSSRGRPGSERMDWRIIRPRKNKVDRLTIHVTVRGKRKQVSLDRLMLAAWAGGDKPECYPWHIDGNVSDNNIDNLAWSDNMQQLRTSRGNHQRVSGSGSIKFGDFAAALRFCRAICGTRRTVTDIARHIGCAEKSVRRHLSALEQEGIDLRVRVEQHGRRTYCVTAKSITDYLTHQ